MFNAPMLTIFEHVQENISAMNKWIENLCRETETNEKDHIEILEMKNIITQSKKKNLLD